MLVKAISMNPSVELEADSSNSEHLMQMSDLVDLLFVQFNRCITSQMIKWFSNFREFYYIQMEKFARQAISDGVTNPKMLVVLRNSELFRALNMHYNKGNDFESPRILSGNNKQIQPSQSLGHPYEGTLVAPQR
ncbi:hypothetical protein P7K49_018323 [Saguinus oedipus]|uniref:Prospero domain-containing protein n=1 Tax=Saguinus oedipus TaxID=9490 RepID=A0ABQ9V7T6_SAGOE|nr:hypothetical protein P7K49_018323 [Saguinus oedipus]